MALDPLVGAAAVSAVPSTLAALLSYRAVRKGKENSQTLARVERATNGEMERKIRKVLRDELIKHSGVTQEMYDLLDAILRNVQGEDNG